ncbi:MurR/RpiR family transcriptional regulator [Salinicoccus sp. HZC-1]|uniref:MurR/RpiR family transcriptional regulator n=1 Tax=Salinicoccus sp. HZC-1 TaxID=3385497 RepID=UPI00398B498D
MEKIYNKISEKETGFSKSFKMIAEHCYKDPHIFAMSSATEAGNKIGVSETTVIRFVNFLGYDGYTSFQKDVIEQLFSKGNLKNYKEDKSEALKRNGSIKESILYDIDDLQKIYNQISEKDLQLVVNKICDADSIFISGFRASHPFANWLSYALDLVKGNARVYSPTVDDVFIRVSEMTEESVFIGFSFHRYAKETIQIAKLAKEQRSTVIIFTDSTSSPISKVADIVVPIQTYSRSTLDVTVIVFSILNSIVSAISAINNEDFQKRSEMFDSVNSEDFYFKGYLE